MTKKILFYGLGQKFSGEIELDESYLGPK